MTSLIDVIFLLLLFFMLSSTFSRFAEVELAAAGAGGNSAQGDTKITFLKLGAERVSLNGQDVEMTGLAEAFAQMPQAEDTLPVVVSLDETVSAQRLTDLLVVLRGIERVSIRVLGS